MIAFQEHDIQKICQLIDRLDKMFTISSNAKAKILIGLLKEEIDKGRVDG